MAQSLNDLVQSVVSAVAEAQDRVLRHQLEAMRVNFFDVDNRPVGIDVRLPDNSSEAGADDERLIRVPLLSLVGFRQLAIKSMDVDMEVALSGMHPPSDVDPNEGSDTETAHRLGVDVHGAKDKSATAVIKLRVEAQDAPEGLARLIQHLDRSL